MKVFPYSIYSMRHSSTLKEAAERGGTSDFDEGRRWVLGRKLLLAARDAEEALPIIFASAEITDRLLYWGIVTGIWTAEDEETRPGTRYSVARLRRVPGELPLSYLRLRSSGKQLSANFIRPYAICHTPDFILNCERT
jgi:hypothetical protein